MEAFLNVTMQQPSNYEARRVPPETHTHDVLRGDLITLEAMGQRIQVHVAAITPETLTLEVQGPTNDHRKNQSTRPRRYILPRNSTLSLSAPTPGQSPTWTFEWTGRPANN
jgi:hypothetical protein